jgi:hypothetical protein
MGLRDQSPAQMRTSHAEAGRNGSDNLHPRKQTNTP